VQAGHPHPVLIRKGGEVAFLGRGGLPIGLIPGATFERIETRLFPGDRLFLVSDGVTECPDPAGIELGAEGLARILRANAGMENQALLETLVWNLHTHAGGKDFPDDVSGVLFHYRG
ncbi:MAG TPA: PP2C family protein-serine/threonine phosphatase, partial [Paracoccaceae bacterium]